MKKTILYIFITLFLIIYSIYYFAVPAIVNHNLDFIFAKINQETGFNIKSNNLKIKTGILPSIIITAEEINIANGLKLNDVFLNVDIIPLVYKTIKINKFSSEKIKTNITLDKNENLFLGSYQIKPLKTNIKLKINNVNIYGFDINFNDEFNSKKGYFTGKHFQIKQNKNLYLAILGDIKINNDISGINLYIKNPNKKDINDLTIQGYITNLDLSNISPYISKISNKNIENISGILNLQAESNLNDINANLSSENFQIKLKNIDKPIYFKNKANIKTNINFSNNAISIETLKIFSKDVKAEVDGIVKDMSSKTPFYNINLKLTNTKSGNILSLIPHMNFPEVDINLKKLIDYGIYGVVNGQINIKGNDTKPDLTGSFLATDVYVQKPLNIPKATIKLDFSDKKCFFNAFAPASEKEYVKVNGNVELYGKRLSEIDISSTSKVNLKVAQIILNPLHEILGFEIGPVPIMDIYGIGNIKLKVKGNKQEPHLFGVFQFENGTVSFNDVNTVIKNASGKLLFEDENMHFITHHALLNNVPIKVDGSCSTQGVLNFNVISNGQSLNESVKILNSSPMLSDINKLTQSITATSGKINLFINLKGKIKHIEDFKLGKTVIASGDIKLLNNNVIINNSALTLKNIFGNIDFNNQDINFNLNPLIGEQRLSIKGKIKDNKIYSKNNLKNLKLKFLNSDILIKTGEINLDGNKIFLNKIDCFIDSKRTLINGNIINVFDNPKLDIYISSSPSQQFIDKYFNKKNIYPFILKGNINYNARLNGTFKLMNVTGTANMEKGSSLYYKGALIDATNNPLKINFNLTGSKSEIFIKKFQYFVINEQNKLKPLLIINGQIGLQNDNINFKNFKIKTLTETDARIFNIIFKKPIIKNGFFTSDITINGNLSTPYATGNFNIFGVDAPFLDTIIHDISINFKNKTSDIKMKGDILSNEILLNANINNSLNPPYVINNANLYLGNFNVNTFLKHLNKINIEDVDKKDDNDITSIDDIDIRNLFIKKLTINAKSVYVRNLFANNVNAVISLKNGIFHLEKLDFITAEGKLTGKIFYNFHNSKMILTLNIDKINANKIFEALFNIKNQFFGDLSGKANLTCIGKTHEYCMKTLYGDCEFNVLEGKMPKLGSLEYLLKSSNTIKSGITGLTLNNIIDLLTPLKTGSFESINGKFSIKNGITDDINIASKGKDLSIFITGNYNFSTSDTSLEVYGRLAKKISNALGIIGNVSINTLFNTIPGVNLSKTNKTEFIQLVNKIPGIELNTNEFRIFFAKIDGNENSENYNTIFKWID